MKLTEQYLGQLNVAELEALISQIRETIPSRMNEEVLRACFGHLDLTTLRNEDTNASVSEFVGKVNHCAEIHPDLPLPGSVCVYSNFAELVRRELNAGIHTTVTAGCFPTSQSFPEVKALEAKMAVEAGADEVDIVLALNKFLAGDLEGTADEIRLVRRTIDEAAGDRKVILKVILETGILATPELIAEASFLSMEAGADFIKTSTGKVAVNATPIAAAVMCKCISAYFEKTGRKVGFKPAGGMKTAEDATLYYNIVGEILGEEWHIRELFRFGVSSMANNLLSAIYGPDCWKF